MMIIYNVSIHLSKLENCFRITWKNIKNDTNVSFEQEITMTTEELRWLCQMPRHRLIIGEKLFHFLDGTEHLFQQSLEKAHRKGTSLFIYLHTCKETANWPFELLTKDGIFLLPEKLHLVRYIPGKIEKKVKAVLPKNRPLKLLFMACSVMDTQPELDFEKEEEAIFHITENLAIEMEVEDSGSLLGLREKLNRQSYDVLHLSGHTGVDHDGQPYFVMEDETGDEHRVFSDRLWNEALIKNPPRLIILSGSTAANWRGIANKSDHEIKSPFAHILVEKYNIPAVLEWNLKVNDEQAILAGKMIYLELSKGCSIVEAVQRARHELCIKFSHHVKSAWPLLKLYASGILLNPLVRKEQTYLPKSRRMKHIYLKNSRVKVLEVGFVGRRRQLQQSLRGLKTETGKVGLLIMGTGGLGKSCLAGKISERFSTHTLIIIQGKFNTLSLNDGLKDAFIISQDEKGKSILAQDIEMKDKLIHLCTTCFKERNYLFLLDDFEKNLEGFEKGEPGDLYPETAALLGVLLHYLTFCDNKSQIIITSRYEFSLPYQEHDIIDSQLEKIWLTGFTKNEQRKKLPSLINISNLENREIAGQLLAAGYGNPRLMEWIDILTKQLKINELETLAVVINDKQEEFIRAHIIRELLKKGGLSLERFLRWFSIYRIPVLEEGLSLLAKKARLKDWKKLLRKGMALSLAEHDEARKSFQVTPLLREELLKGIKDHLCCHKAAFAYFKKICEAREVIDPVLTEEWIYHALGCEEEEVASLQGYDLIVHLRDSLAYNEALRVGEWIIAEKNDLSTLDDSFLLNAISTVLHHLGDHQRELAICEATLSLDRRLYGEKNPKVTIDLNNLGETWIALGKPQKALELFQQALEIDQEFLGEKHPKLAGTLNNLGEIYRELNHPAKAIEYYQKALIIDKEEHSEKHPDSIRDINNLGLAHLHLGRYKQAAKYFKKAFDIELELYGEEHPRTADTMNNLAVVSIELAQFDKAIDYYQMAICINRKIFGEIHYSVSNVLNNLGAVWDTLGNYDKAVDYYTQALEIDRKVYGESHQRVAADLNNLGSTQNNLGKIEMALEYFYKSLAIDLQIYGEKHSCVSRDYNNLGNAFHDLGKVIKAIEYYEKALVINHSLWGDEHPDVALTMNNLGDAWKDLGEYNKALEYFEKALATWEKFYQEVHPNLGIAANNLGLVWMALGNCDKAIDYFEESINIYKIYFGSEHPDLAKPMVNLGSLYVQLEEKEEAKKYLKNAYQLFKKFLGPKHTDTKNAKEWLDDCR